MCIISYSKVDYALCILNKYESFTALWLGFDYKSYTLIFGNHFYNVQHLLVLNSAKEVWGKYLQI